MKKEDFPALDDSTVYLDSACMSLKPQQVIDKVNEYYTDYPGCSGRSGHSFSRKAQQELEDARKKVAGFIDSSKDNLMFTSGTTESINTVAQGLDVDRVFITDKEHNSNRVVWEELGVEIVEMNGLDKSFIASEIGEDDLLSVLHTSNLDGETFELEEVCKIVREKDAYSLIDAAQSIPHRPFSVKNFKPSFVAFSGHKMLGPTGTGALHVSDRAINSLKPLKYGGGAVKGVVNGGTRLKDFPQGFEPGLKNLAGFTGFGAAAEYLDDIGMRNVKMHEEELTEFMVEELRSQGFQVLNKGAGIVSIVTESMTAAETAEILDRRGIKLRSGQHCVHKWFKDKEIESTLRASMHLYNDKNDIRKFLDVMRQVSRL